jgi:molecular chaperone GrpE
MAEKMKFKMSKKKTSKKHQDNVEQPDSEAVDQNEETQQEVENNNAPTDKDSSEKESADKKTEESAEPTLEEQVQAEKDRYLRLYAEFENFRRRTAKEKLDLIAGASGDVIKEILPVLDDMERAIDSNKSSQDVETVKEGFELVYNKLIRTLKSKGLQEMDSKDNEFDTDKHEAITKIPAPSEEQKGKVVDVVEKGYYLNDKVIRYAKVVIGE